MYVLKIKVLEDCPNRDYVRDYYKNKINTIGYHGDAGIDLIFPDDVTCETGKVTYCNLGIACEMQPLMKAESVSFSLEARSSISKTPLMLANSRGIIDSGYRGPIIAALRCFIDKNHPSTIDNFTYQIKKGDRLVQIVSPNLNPIIVMLVDELSETDRGSQGFGSTDNK